MAEQDKDLGKMICRMLSKLDAQSKSRALGVLEGMAIMADRAAQTQPGAVRPGA